MDANDATGYAGTTGQAEYMPAGAGNDPVNSRLGHDIVYGGSSNDTVYGDDGNDSLLAARAMTPCPAQVQMQALSTPPATPKVLRH